jgi:hypothetical protein
MPFLLIFFRRLLSNYIIPSFKKREIYQSVITRADWKSIEETQNILHQVFKNTHGKRTSILYRAWHWKRNKEFIYGEIDFLSFYLLLEKVKPQVNEVFYDLGSGTGKAVMTAGLFFDLSKSCGIELLPPLYQQAKLRLAKAIQWAEQSNEEKKIFKRMLSIEYINDSFLHYDFHDADIIYIAATCLSDDTWLKLINKLTMLKPGSRIIVATKHIQHQNFEMMYQGIELMSWGLCPLSIYRTKG